MTQSSQLCLSNTKSLGDNCNEKHKKNQQHIHNKNNGTSNRSWLSGGSPSATAACVQRPKEIDSSSNNNINPDNNKVNNSRSI